MHDNAVQQKSPTARHRKKRITKKVSNCASWSLEQKPVVFAQSPVKVVHYGVPQRIKPWFGRQ